MADILVVKVNMFCKGEEMDDIRNYIIAQKKMGVVLLPPYCEAVVVPEDVEIRVEESFRKKYVGRWVHKKNGDRIIYIPKEKQKKYGYSKMLRCLHSLRFGI